MHANFIKLSQNYLHVVGLYQHKPTCIIVNDCETMNHISSQNYPYPQITVNRNILYKAFTGVGLLQYKHPIVTKLCTMVNMVHKYSLVCLPNPRWQSAAILDFNFVWIRHRIISKLYTHVYIVQKLKFIVCQIQDGCWLAAILDFYPYLLIWSICQSRGGVQVLS